VPSSVHIRTLRGAVARARAAHKFLTVTSPPHRGSRWVVTLRSGPAPDDDDKVSTCDSFVAKSAGGLGRRCLVDVLRSNPTSGR